MTSTTHSRAGARPASWIGPVAFALAAAIAWPASSPAQQAESSEELARRFLDSGRRFFRDGRPGEGLKDLQRVVDVYPTSSVADDALIEIAQYQLVGNGDPVAARAAIEAHIAKYPSADTAPMAYVLAGRIGLAESETPEGIDEALANFERVRTLYPRSAAVAASFAYAGDAHRQARRAADAVRAYERAATEYPRAPWTARALLGLAAARVAAQQPVHALEALSQLQATFPGSAEAAQARERAMILYRLHLRAPAAPAFAATERTIAGSGGRLDDVDALAAGPDGSIAVLQRQGATRYEADGRLRDGIRAVDARALALRPDGQLLVATRGGLQSASGPPLSLSVPRAGGAPRPLEDVRAVALSRTGQYLVADGGSRAIARFGTDGTYVGPFAAVDAVRLAANDVGLVAALERGGKAVAVLDAAGKPAGRIGATGKGFTLQQAVDLAWDALGYLYVLDRDAGAVLVFDPALQHVTTHSVPQRMPASFRRATAFAVDGAGRLFIYDDRAKSIRVHQ
jgi:outer membrane protein assembly factor BamD (BamD/ComL family)